jgi:flagellar motility protein MotE (MotC chaperone)
MSGYDQFFKEASKASGLSSGKSAPKASIKASNQATPKTGGKAKNSQFKIKESSFSGNAEDRLRQEVALRARNRKSASMRKRAKFPMGPAIIAVVAIISCTIGFLKPDMADQLLTHIDIGFFGKALAATPATESKANAKSATTLAAKSAETKAQGPAKESLNAVALKSEVPPDFRNWSDEELSFFNKLNDRKKELDLREAELNKLDEELQKQKAELDSKIKQLEAMRGDISKTLKARVEVDQEKIEKLVQFYSTMKPEQAAKVIESINEDLAVEVMDKMKKKNAAAIMDALDPKKARRLSEMLTGYQRSPASADSESK